MTSLLLTVKVTPKSSKNEIVGWMENTLLVKLRAVPEKGEANQALIEILSKELNLPKNSIEIYRGTKSRLKTVKFKNFYLSVNDLKKLL